MNVVVLESEAFNQLQPNTFNHVRALLEAERREPTFGWVDNEETAVLLGVSPRTL